MQNATDVHIELLGTRSPFGIQPRCPMFKMMNVVSSTFGITINKITVKSGAFTPVRELNISPEWRNKYLIEDHMIKKGDVITIHTLDKLDKINPNNNTNSDFNLNITINLIFQNHNPLKVLITKYTTVKSIIDLLIQNMYIIPSTIKLFYDNVELNNMNKLLVDYGVQDGHNIIVEETRY